MMMAIAAAGCGNPQGVTVQDPVRQEGQKEDTAQLPPETKEDVLDKFKLIVSQAKDAGEVVQFLDTHLPEVTQKQADQLFLELEDFYDRYLPSLNDNFATMLSKPETSQKMNEVGYPININNIKGDDTLKQWLLDQQAGGLALGNTEGEFFWKVDYKALQKYDKYVSNDIRSYQALKSEEAEKSYFEDGTIAITREKLGDRIMKAELYLTENPEGLKAKEVLQMYKDYLHAYLTDFRYDAIDDRTLKLLPAVKKSFQTFVNTHPDAKTTVIVQKYLNVINNNKDVIYEKGTNSIQGPLKKDIQSFWDSLNNEVDSLFVA
ncbi:hypothetical protein [Paenibacillus sp.]|uniref:hypothetical protein n=1 Tax=Paenibacillus sp. TaxID=58172 RepID=UPI00282D889C|nr:hypothetical protein [Paenibacillus sp.]MDR0267148.1 hypothetical protein [Paenibacillus sp.]